MNDEHLYECVDCGVMLGEQAGDRIMLSDEESETVSRKFGILVEWKLDGSCPACGRIDPPIRIVNKP